MCLLLIVKNLRLQLLCAVLDASPVAFVIHLQLAELSLGIRHFDFLNLLLFQGSLLVK